MTEQSPMKLISRTQPHIETLQVSVQVVRIGPKQMTQAVFRQLKNKPLVDCDTLELRGVPWGTVNYNPGDCDSGMGWDHVHVVWQRGDTLRRCCFPLRYRDEIQQEIFKCLGTAVHEFDPAGHLDYSRTLRRPEYLRSFLARAEVAYAEGWPSGGFPRGRKALDDFAHALQELEAVWSGIQSRHTRWQEHVEEIETLPQLFIAV